MNSNGHWSHVLGKTKILTCHHIFDPLFFVHHDPINKIKTHFIHHWILDTRVISLPYVFGSRSDAMDKTISKMIWSYDILIVETEAPIETSLSYATVLEVEML